ncbi:hypothetical protein RhiLY_05230 [Ceratobasidium sp. AG-Ba]|nr:hypothetical protein RhiLY_05230 [Ceratobasidium sp. AG-Ba]
MRMGIPNWRQRVHFADMSAQNEESEEGLSDDEFSLPPSPPAIPPGLKDKILVIESEDEGSLMMAMISESLPLPTCMRC